MQIEEVKEHRGRDRPMLHMEVDLAQRRDGLLEEAAKQFDGPAADRSAELKACGRR